MRRRKVAQNARSAIAAAIVHENQLVRLAHAAQDRIQPLERLRQHFLFVIRGHHNRKHRIHSCFASFSRCLASAQ